MPLHYEECVTLQKSKSFLTIYSVFVERNFTVKHRVNNKSRVLLDQDIEIWYNKPEKGSSRTIEYIEKHENVLKWNVMNCKRLKLNKLLHDICCLNDDRKYFFYHHHNTAQKMKFSIRFFKIWVKKRIPFFLNEKLNVFLFKIFLF